jgi:hypothetical protein
MTRKRSYNRLPANGITTPPVVAIASASAVSAPVGAIASAASAPVVASASAVSPPVVANATHVIDLDNDPYFAKAFTKMQNKDHHPIVGNTHSGVCRILTLPDDVAMRLSTLAEKLAFSFTSREQFYAHQNFWNFYECSGNGYYYVTLSQGSFPTVWSLFIHEFNIIVYINAQSPALLRIAPPNLEWMQELTLPIAIRFLKDYMNDVIVFVPSPQPEQPEQQQPFIQKDGDFPAMGAPAPAYGSQVKPPLSSIVSGAGATVPAPSKGASASSSDVLPTVASASSSVDFPALGAPASSVSITCQQIAPSVALILASVVARQDTPAGAPFAVASTVVVPVAPVETEDFELLKFKQEQAIALAKFELTQNHKKKQKEIDMEKVKLTQQKKIVLEIEAKLAALIVDQKHSK